MCCFGKVCCGCHCSRREASGRPGYEHTPMLLLLELLGAWGPSTTGALRKRTAYKVGYSGYGSGELEDGY